jgi:hypothetical protein
VEIDGHQSSSVFGIRFPSSSSEGALVQLVSALRTVSAEEELAWWSIARKSPISMAGTLTEETGSRSGPFSDARLTRSAGFSKLLSSYCIVTLLEIQLVPWIEVWTWSTCTMVEGIVSVYKGITSLPEMRILLDLIVWWNLPMHIQ